MSESDPNRNQEQTPEGPPSGPSYTPASFEKRTAAWMGVAYTVMLVLIITFSISSGGQSLPGTFPLFLVPVCTAAAVVCLYRQKKGAAWLPLTLLVLLCCVAGVLLGLGLGVPALVSGLQAFRR